MWRKGRLVNFCEGICGNDGSAAILYATPEDPDIVVLLANVTKRVTRRSLEQRAMVQQVTPSVRVVGEEHLRKIPGCVSTRKRIWTDLQERAGPEAKRLCVGD